MPPPPHPEAGALLRPTHVLSSLHGALQTLAASSLSILATLVLVTVLLGCIRWALLQHLQRKRKKARITPAPPEKRPAPPLLPAPSSLPTSRPAVTFKPIYPWTSPPQPLPGPYDPRLYPAPTLRRHSYPDPSPPPATTTTTTLSYTRRVSTNSIPPRHAAVLHGTITTASAGATRGWRRNHWVVGGAG